MKNQQFLLYSGITIATVIAGLSVYLYMTDHLKPKKDKKTKD